MNDQNFYVELIDTRCEGFLPIADLQEEIEIHRNRLSAKSGTRDFQWKIGDKVRVKVVAADLDERELVFALDEAQ